MHVTLAWELGAGATALWVATYPDTIWNELAYKTMLFTGVSKAAQERLNALDNVPHEHQPLVTDAEDYLHLREESWRLRAEGLRKNNGSALLGVDSVAVDASTRRRVEASHRKHLLFRGKIEAMERASLEAFERIKRSDINTKQRAMSNE